MPGEVVQKIKFGNHIFIEHAADVVSVCFCSQTAETRLNSEYTVRIVGKRCPKYSSRGPETHRAEVMVEGFFLNQ